MNKTIRLISFSTILILFYSCVNSTKSNDIPAHEYFTNSNTQYEDFEIDPEYLKKMGENKNDTMIILTNSKVIFIFGQYGIQANDSIIIPYSGEFGINYQIIDNTKYNLKTDSIIRIRNQKFVRRKNVNFQWWNEIKDKITEGGKGSIRVSGP